MKLSIQRQIIRLSSLGMSAVLLGSLTPGLGIQSVGAADEAVIRPLPDVAPTDNTGRAIRFREDLGLRADRAHVEQIEGDARASSAEFGYPLMPDELAYLRRRESVRDKVGPLKDYLDRFPATFAGVYLDNPGARQASVALKVVVAFTAEPESHRGEISKLLPPDSLLELRSATYSQSELESIVQAVTNDRDWHRSLGIDVYMAGVDDQRNKVLLGISTHDEMAASALAARYGRDRTYIFVSAAPKPDACTRTACPPPWPAGLNINTSSNPASGSHCTSGYSMKSSTGNWYMLTAGHCPSDRWYHNGTFMGGTPAGKNTFYNNSEADVQAYDVANGNQSNVVLTGSKTCNPCLFRTMTARQLAGHDVLNDTTCISGAYSGSNCGVLKIKNAAFFYADYGVTLNNQRTASYTRMPGDSGGPIFRSTVALGSHVHFQPDTGWGVYSHINWAEIRLGLTMCFSGC